MADSKVSGLTAAAAFLTTHEIPVNEGGTSKKLTGTLLRAGVVPQAASFPSSLNPTGTTSLTGVMMGMGSSFQITPSHSGSLLIMIQGAMGNNTASDHTECQLAYGLVSGGVPANAAASTGTALGSLRRFSNNANTAAVYAPFAIMEYVSGLTLGVAYWVDLNLKAVTGGTANLFNVDCVMLEF